MAAVIVDDIGRCLGCGAHYSVRVAAGLSSPDAQRWCTSECWRRKPTPHEADFAAFVQGHLDRICRESGSGEWDKLLPAQRLKIWQDFLTSAPRREPVIRGHSTGL